MASYDGRLRHLPERLALSLKGGAIGAIVPHLIGTPELVMRIAIGAALGGVIGYERRHHRRPVGLRTHLIVAMAAATFMVISSQFVYYQHYGKEDLVTVDSSRIAASVVSGIGFLAGGAILRTGLTVQGLTTAAGLWLVTAIGMSAGSGMFTVSAVVTAMGIVALTLLRRFENKDDSIRRRMVVVTDDEADIDQILKALEEVGAVVADLEIERRLDEGKRGRRLTFDLKFPDTLTVPKIVAVVEAVRGIRRIIVQQRV